MTTRRRLPGALLCAAALLLIAFPAPAQPEKSRNHFDSDAPMREPGFFDFVTLGSPGQAQWRVVTEFNPPSAPNGVSQVITERPADSIAVAVRRNVKLRDGSLSIGIKRTAGRGGIVFRMADEKNYLALLIDPISGDARLLQSVAGRTHELARGNGQSTRDWAFLTIQADGAAITASWEDKPLLKATDPAPVSGRTGIATAGPGIVTFDEFVIEPKE
jgi:hypothetical protein